MGATEGFTAVISRLITVAVTLRTGRRTLGNQPVWLSSSCSSVKVHFAKMFRAPSVFARRNSQPAVSSSGAWRLQLQGP